MKPTVGILILNRNGKDWLPALYRSLFADPYEEKRIYLVDNQSGDGSCEMTVADYPQVKVLRLPDNLGYSTAYNLCVPIAIAEGCEYVIWSNNDIIIQPNCIAELVRIARTDPRIGVVGPALLAWGSDEPNDFIKENYPHVIPAMEARSEEPIDIEWVEGSFPLVSKQCIDAIGCLDPYLHMGWEDADFCRRARHQGWRVVLAPAARVHHYSGGWTKASPYNTSYLTGTKAKNYYIYKLTNPNQHLPKNLADATHLFLGNIKACLTPPVRSVLLEISTFLGVLGEWKLVRNKWRCDKVGEKPPLTKPCHRLMNPQVIVPRDTEEVNRPKKT